MISALLLTSLLGLLPLAAFSGALGCVVLWRSMAYYGDAMAHAALLGVAISLMFPAWPQSILVFAVILAISFLLQRVSQRFTMLSANTLLGMMAYSALAIGMLLLHIAGEEPVDIHDILFGDPLSVSANQAAITAGVCMIGLLVLIRLWRRLALFSLSEPLAKTQGVETKKLSYLFLLLLAALVALATPIFGVLLVVAMLIFPAAIARLLATTPGNMGRYAAIIASITAASGLWLASQYNLPIAPLIIAEFAALFVIVAAGVVLRTFNRH
jgi:zinc transport system permease protein